MDEPESRHITIATRTRKLDNGAGINCNLQRLDGPVAVTARLLTNWKASLQVLAGTLHQSHMWGGRWDELLRKDTSGKLIQLMNETVDGDYQTFKSGAAAYVREHFNCDQIPGNHSAGVAQTGPMSGWALNP